MVGLPTTTWAAALFIFFAVALLRDESRPATFSGLVLDNSEQPIQGAMCVLGRAGAVGQQALTDAGGRFRFDDVADDTVRVQSGLPSTSASST